MSTPPGGRQDAHDLLATLIRTAAPRLGRVAVARITGPLTEAVIAMRAEALAEADGWHQVAGALGAADPTDPASAMGALQAWERTSGAAGLAAWQRVARQVDPGGSLSAEDVAARIETALDQVDVANPVQVGDVLDSRHQLNAAARLDGVVITGARSDLGAVLYVSSDGQWFAPGSSVAEVLVCAGHQGQGWTVERVPGGAS